jgi:uncharacterized protein HemX
MAQDKEPASITEQICFVLLFSLLFLAAGFSYGTQQRVEALDEKIQIRDSIILRMEKHQERQDSIMFDYMDKWIEKMYRKQ